MPSNSNSIPLPPILFKCSGIFAVLKLFTIAFAIGWVEYISPTAAISKISSLVAFISSTSARVNSPLVTVPVLSKATPSISVKASIEFPPFTKIDLLEREPIPAKIVRGTEIAKAQGQDITKNMAAL